MNVRHCNQFHEFYPRIWVSTVMLNAFYFVKSRGMDRNTEPFWVEHSGIRVVGLHAVEIQGPVQQQTLTTFRGLLSLE